MKLNQVIALVQGRKARAIKTLTEAYRWEVDKLKGLSRNYTPLDDAGEQLPSENKIVPLHADDIIAKVIERLNEYYNAVITQETANQQARADIVVDGEIVLKDVPVTVLLFLDKQLPDLITFVKSFPVLPIDKEWKWDQKRGCWATKPEATTRTKKVPKPIVKYDATKEHPAQTEMYAEDIIVGHWSTVHMSGAVQKTYKGKIIRRIEKLQDAVKKAREVANGLDIGGQMSKAGQTFVGYIFQPIEKPIEDK